MPPISPIKDENTGKTVKSATLTPFRTMSIDEVHRLITSDQRLAELTLAIRNAAAQGDEITARFLKQQTLPTSLPAEYLHDDGVTASRNPPGWSLSTSTTSNLLKKRKTYGNNCLMTPIYALRWCSSAPPDGA